jgi:hypothetical protein
VPTMQVQRNDIGKRIDAVIGNKRWFDTSDQTGAITVAPV